MINTEKSRILGFNRKQTLLWRGSCFWKTYEHKSREIIKLSFWKKKLLLRKVKQNAKLCGFELWKNF